MNDVKSGQGLEPRIRKARRWGRVAGERALSAQDTVTSERKGDDEGLVTELDRSIETYLREKISQTFPSDRVVGEEFSPAGDEAATVTWYLDPIDGTAAYSMSLPIWAVCMGLTVNGTPAGGVMLSPGVGDEYYGWNKGPTRKNNSELTDAVESPENWDDESLLCVRSDMHRRWDVDFVGKCRSLGSSAYHMGLVLDGRAVGTLLGHLHIWDVAAACGLSNSTGFMLRTLNGDSPDWNHFLQGKTSRDPLVFAHESVMESVRKRIQAH
jgi:fructose-1,6-bisphosphatase/inositol monophosphatase family enzyme